VGAGIVGDIVGANPLSIEDLRLRELANTAEKGVSARQSDLLCTILCRTMLHVRSRHVSKYMFGAEGGIQSLCLPVRATACKPNVNGPVRLGKRCLEMPAIASPLLQELLQKRTCDASRSQAR
jgi:hypothetical protein